MSNQQQQAGVDLRSRGDQLRAIARQAENNSGPSDTTQPVEYVLAGWQAAIAADRQQRKVGEDIFDYVKGIYGYLKSVAPDGQAEEAFRLPPSATRAQRSLFDFATSDASGERPTPARQDTNPESTDGRPAAVEQRGKVEPVWQPTLQQQWQHGRCGGDYDNSASCAICNPELRTAPQAEKAPSVPAAPKGQP